MKDNYCICPRECDCQNPEPESGVAGVSNNCPIHNLYPNPNPDCEAQNHWFEENCNTGRQK